MIPMETIISNMIFIKKSFPSQQKWKKICKPLTLNKITKV